MSIIIVDLYLGYSRSLKSFFVVKLHGYIWKYMIKSNRETGSGKTDIFLEKNDHRVECVFEFKISEMENLTNIAKEQM